MEHYLDQDIALLDDTGTIIGNKKPQEVDRQTDSLYCAYVFVITGSGKLAMARLPQKEPRLKFYGGKLGTTIASLVLAGESRDEAVRRVLRIELFVEDAEPRFLGEAFGMFPNDAGGLVGHRNAVYYLSVAENELKYNSEKVGGLEYVTRVELELRLAQEPENFTPSFVWMWEEYKDKLPLAAA